MKIYKTINPDGEEGIKKVYKRDDYEVYSVRWVSDYGDSWAVALFKDGRMMMHSSFSTEIKTDADAEDYIKSFEILMEEEIKNPKIMFKDVKVGEHFIFCGKECIKQRLGNHNGVESNAIVVKLEDGTPLEWDERFKNIYVPRCCLVKKVEE